METDSNPPTLTAIAKNDVKMNDDVEGIQQELIARKQQPKMMALERDRETAYVELASMKPSLPNVPCKKSQFNGYCRAYSHWQFMTIPEIEISIPVSP